jgi:hypothetical protein
MANVVATLLSVQAASAPLPVRIGGRGITEPLLASLVGIMS